MLKIILNKALKLCLDSVTSNLEQAERHSLYLAVKEIIKSRWLLLLLLASALIGALFEGGTIGLLGVAVSILVDGELHVIKGLPKQISNMLDSSIAGVSKGTIFLFLVVIAVTSQVLKNVFLYLSEACQIILSYRLRRQLQKKAVSYVLSMSYSDATSYSTGTLATVIDQVDIVAQIMAQIMAQLMTQTQIMV